MESFYKPPKPKKKRLKASLDMTVAPSLTVLSNSSIYGIMWGGNVWINDKNTIRLLTDNGCYGNSVMSRHSLSTDQNVSKDNGGCGVTEEEPVNTSLLKESESCSSDPRSDNDYNIITRGSPPNKKPKLCNNDEMDGFLNDIMLNTASYHILYQEEAFHLIHKSCLIVKNVNGIILSIKDIWRKMVEYDEKFVVKYPAYEYFRNEGWVPKCGTKFGVDYLLYERGPMYNHSSYGVTVIEEDITNNGKIQASDYDTGKDGCQRDTQTDSKKMQKTWHDVLGTGRVNEGAKKELVVCCVSNKDKQLHKEGDWLTNSDVTVNTGVKCVVVKRWLVEKDRI